MRLSSPYREADLRKPSSEPGHHGSELADGDLVPVFGVLWVVSGLQVRGALHDVRCDPVDALAGLALVVLPWMIRAPLRELVRRAAQSIRKV